MSRSLRGQVVVITGASAGIGRAAARRFAREGARVVVAARRAERLRALREEIQAAGGECLDVPTDVADPAQIERLASAAQERFGRLDIWINNAGFGLLAGLEQTTLAELQQLWAVNTLGAFCGCQAALRRMRPQGSGHLINVASLAARFPLPLAGAYSATKAAMAALSEALALELAGSGIHVSTLLVGLTETEFELAQTRKVGAEVAGRWPRASAEQVAGRIVACARRPQPLVVFLPFPRLVLALLDLCPGIWRRGVRRFLKMTPGADPPPASP